MDPRTYEAVALSLKVAACAMGVIVVPSIGAGYLLARFEFQGKRILSALLTLPLVLPPTAVGFLLLRLLASDGPLGRDRLGFDLRILLSWRAAVLAASVMAFPLVLRTARITFEQINPRIEMMARTLGYGRRATFFLITLPMARRGLLAAFILGFTRALGEFGATIILAGNIPGKTETLPLAIFGAQQAGDDERAVVLMAIALLVGLVAILSSEALVRSPKRRKR